MPNEEEEMGVCDVDQLLIDSETVHRGRMAIERIVLKRIKAIHWLL